VAKLAGGLQPWRPVSSPSAEQPSALARASLYFAYFRWLFMPLGLFALIAVVIHAAADTVDHRVLWLIDRADAAFDAFFGQWSLTQPMVDWVGLEQRIWLARSIALLWELAADLFLALPALGYEEHDTQVPLQKRWKPLFQKLLQRPEPMLFVRPLFTAAVVLAGSCSVARMVQGAFYLSLRSVLTDGVAGPAARVLALAALGVVLARFGGRAVLRNVQHANEMAEKDRARTRLKRWTRGLVGSLIVAPLAVGALVDASPLLSFFR
jgi:hypothetical protein